jgi:hypothetical protein
MKVSEFIEKLNNVVENGNIDPDMDIVSSYIDKYGSVMLMDPYIRVEQYDNGKPFVHI